MTAVIGYDNILDQGAVVTSDPIAADDFPVENSFNYFLSDAWKAGSIVLDNFLDIDTLNNKSANYFALAGHSGNNFDSLVFQLKPQFSSTFFGQIVTNTNRPVLRKFPTSVFNRLWQLRAVGSFGASEPLSIGHLSLGTLLDLPSCMRSGFRLPTFARSNSIYNNLTETGQFTGRSVYRRGLEFDIEQTLVDPDWVRTNWDALADHIETKPFFFAWDIEGHPDEVSYCWLREPLEPPRYMDDLYMTFTLKVQGV